MLTQPTFRLSRYFSALSLLLITLAGLALGWSARSQATSQMSEMAQSSNEAMARIFINVLWPEFEPLVSGSTGLNAGQLREEVARRDLQNRTRNLMRHSNIVKVKVYNTAGVTVFSSDLRQIGEDKRDNAGFRSALAGKPASELTHRDQFDGFEGTISELDVISSYLPITMDGQTPGVLEIYLDVTPFVHNLDQVLFEVAAVGSLVLMLLYLMQLVVVRRAQAILLSQEQKLVSANRELDARVESRTRDLAESNASLQAEVAERSRTEARLDHLAHHDPLTGLPNRRMFSEVLEQKIDHSPAGRSIGVLYIDLDRFKDVNDTMGHTVGDELVIEVSRRLVGALNRADMLARLGGDEFVCVLSDLQAPGQAGQTAQRLIERIAVPISLRGHTFRVSASIGISLYPSDGVTTDDLLRAADTAMYEAKKLGRNRYHFYTAQMTRYAQERTLLDRHLHQAIERNELAVHYQLKVTADSRAQPCGAEALVRWNHPVMGGVAPTRFIPVAEDTGQIVRLGTWVLRSACRQMAQWHAAGLQVPRISVNLSVRQLERDDVVDVVRQALADAPLSAGFLELEITESVIMNAETSIQAMEQLSALGLHLSVDDFGTGYSSLAYLKMLPIDTLKIDRSFVVGIGDNQGDESIIRAVINMARSLGIQTIAEGVETIEQRDFLEREGCNQIQGHLFGMAEDAATFAIHWQERSHPTPPFAA